MIDPDRPAGTEPISAPGLLIVTGASHTGKTTVARAVVSRIPPPVAYLSLDDVLDRILVRSRSSIWEQIPLAYDLLRAELGILLDDGWFVVLESTFTYVPADGAPEFHVGALSRMLGEAEARDLPCSVVQLRAPKDVVLARVAKTDRLDQGVVAATIVLHESADFPRPPTTIDTERLGPDQAAAAILDGQGQVELTDQGVDQSRKDDADQGDRD